MYILFRTDYFRSTKIGRTEELQFIYLKINRTQKNKQIDAELTVLQLYVVHIAADADTRTMFNEHCSNRFVCALTFLLQFSPTNVKNVIFGIVAVVVLFRGSRTTLPHELTNSELRSE